MTKFGYARVSTQSQSFASQVELLKANGAEEIYKEKFTGTTTERPQFNALLNVLKGEDTLIVTKLDRLARNTKEALDVLDVLKKRGVVIDVINLGRIDNTPAGTMLVTMLLAVAQMERDMIVSRTQEGKDYAKKHNPNYHEGRPKRRITPHYQAIYEYLQDHTYTETQKAFNVARATIYRIKKQIETEQV